jgi:hypothetical protein
VGEEVGRLVDDEEVGGLGEEGNHVELKFRPFRLR